MIKKLFVLSLLSGSLSATAQQLPNVGFNSWKTTCGKTFQASTSGGKEAASEIKAAGLITRPGVEPEGWNGSNVDQVVALHGTSDKLVTKQSDTEHGNYLKLSNHFVGVMSFGATAPAYITFGTPWVYACASESQQDGGTYGGTDFKFRPDAIKGKFKRTNVSGKSEKAHIITYLWTGTFTSKIGKKSPGKISKSDVDRAIMAKSNAGTITGNGKLIASADYEFATTKNDDWEEIIVPINYKDYNTIPEKMNVIVSSADYWNRSNIVSVNDGVDGSTLCVDDLEFVYYKTLDNIKVNGKTIDLNDGVYNYEVNDKLAKGSVVITPTSKLAQVAYTYGDGSVTAEITFGDGTKQTYTIKEHSEKPAPVAANIAGPYNSRIDVTMDVTASSLNDIVLEANSDNTINFLLNNFSFPGIGKVGDIAVKNVPLSWNNDNVSLNCNQVISLDGDLADDLNLKNMPLSLNAEVSPEGALTAKLNISWTNPSNNQIVPIIVEVSKSPIEATAEGTYVSIKGEVNEDIWSNIISSIVEGKTSLDFTDATITYEDFAYETDLYDNVVYYVGDNNFTGTNIVKDGTTETLNLIDGEAPFGIPQTFTANEVAYDRTLTTTNDYVSSFILPFAFDVPKGTTVAELSAVNGNTLVFKPVTRTEANKPYIIITNNENVLSTFSNVTVEATNGTDLTTIVNGVKHIGSYTTKEVENVYGYANGKFVKANTGTVNPFRTYIEMPNTASAPKAFNISIEGTTTGINHANATNAAATSIYNLQGIRMSNDLNGLSKGVYIVNGKKVIK